MRLEKGVLVCCGLSRGPGGKLGGVGNVWSESQRRLWEGRDGVVP